MTKATKEAMSKDAKKAALQNQLVSALNISASESKKIVDDLDAKYGDQAKEIAVNCLMRPYEMKDALGMKGQCTSKSMLKYFTDEKRSAETINKSVVKIKSSEKAKTPTKNRADTKASMKNASIAAKDKATKAKSNIGNYDWAGNATPAWKPKEIKAADRPATTKATTKKPATKKPAEKMQPYDWAANQPKGWQPKDIKASEKTATTTAKKSTTKQSGEKLQAYDWAGNQTPAWKPKDIKADGKTTTTTAKKTTTKQSGEKLQAYDWAGNQTPAWQPKDIKAAPAKTGNATARATTTPATNKGASRTTTSAATKSNIGGYDWQANATKAWEPKDTKPKQQAQFLTADEKFAKAKGSKGYITFDDLQQAGIDVSTADIQAVIDKQKSLEGKAKVIQSIAPGKRAQDLSDYMTKNTRGRPQGDCLTGVQTGMVNVYGSDEASPINGMNEEWKEYKHAKSNSACDAHHLLDNSGDWVTIDVKNSAYHDASKNGEMQAFNSQLRSGTVASTDNLAIEGSRGYENGTRSAIHGHIWVKGKNGENLSDGVQSESGIDFSRYGKEMHVSISTDSRIPDDLAKEFIAMSEQRRSQYSMLQENVYKAKKAR